MQRKPIIGIMGGGAASPATKEKARETGRLVAAEGWVLLNGGRNAGIMAASAKGAAEKGGIVVGILPGDTTAGMAPQVSIPIVTGIGNARNAVNVLSSDVVLAFPGGAGTVSEIALALKSGKTVLVMGFDPGPLFAEYRKMREEIDANPEIHKQPRWFEKISGVYWRMARAHRVVRIFERQQDEPTLPVRLHVVRIGDMAIATHPVALYLDFGIQIRGRSKATQTFTVQTADGHYRYLPTERSLAGNTYGAVPESIEFGPQGGRELVEETVRLIESLWRDADSEGIG